MIVDFFEIDIGRRVEDFGAPYARRAILSGMRL